MITSIVINSLTIGTYESGYLLKSLSGFGFPEVRIDVKNRGNFHGARLGTYKYGRRIMSIEGEIIGSSPSDYESKRRALEQSLLLDDGLATITLNTRGGLSLEADVMVNAMLEVPYTAGDMIRGVFRIELVAPYPWLKGADDNSEELDIYEGGGGGIPATIPFSLGVGGTGLEILENAGNGRAYPVIKIYGVCSNPSIRNESAGETLSITYDLTSSSDYIEIDTYNRTVLLNGTTNIKQYFSGDWVSLIAGNNEFKFTASSYDATARSVIEWRDHYLGI